MQSESPDWLESAYGIYRLARMSIEKWKGRPSDDVELDFYIEELKDELLDLKQATIDKDVARVAESVDEVVVLIAEIRLRAADD